MLDLSIVYAASVDAGEPQSSLFEQDADDATLHAVVRALAELTDPGAILLFGSRARGDARDNSDWDIAVILRDDVDAGRFNALNLWRAVEQFRFPVDIYPLRQSAFLRARDDRNAMSADIARDGVILYGAWPSPELRVRRTG